MQRLGIGCLLVLVVACALPPVVVAPEDAGVEVPDAGPPAPPRLGWTKATEAPPTRSNQVAFYSAAAKATLIFSGNHNTGPIHDAWAWNGTSWARRPLADAEYPERKNAGLAIDRANNRAFVFGGVWSGYPPDGGPYTVRTLGDLQRWDGTKWSEVATTGGPPPRAGHAMAWDEARSQLVLFGGSDNVTVLADTWTFDGQAWTQHATGAAAHPPARLNTRMAYDPKRQRVVLFSGQDSGPGGAINLQDTWEWDGASWVDVTGTGPKPDGRGHHAMQWDPVRERVMMMSGARHFSPIPPGSTLADQWEWDGTQWSRLEPAGARPPARTAPSLSFDFDRKVMVLYGGFDDTDLSDLWEWNGQTWVDRAQLPLPRTDFAFAQAGPGKEAVLFGGYVSAGGIYLRDTFRFVVGQWVRVTGAAPPARSTASLAYHGDDAVLFGGVGRQGTSTVLRGDMWILKAGTNDWVQQTVALPPARRGAAIGFDPERGITVLFGGRGGTTPFDDTWTWNGTAWTKLDPPRSPSARSDAALRFDPARKALVLLGGTAQGGGLPNDAWSFDGTTWTQLAELTAAPSARALQATAFDSRGRLLSWGGRFGDSVLGDLAVHESGDWRAVEPGPTARFGAAWVDLGSDRWLSVFGSRSDFTSTWEDFADVWELAPAQQ